MKLTNSSHKLAHLQIPRSPGYTKYSTFIIPAVQTQRVLTYGTLNFDTPKISANCRWGRMTRAPRALLHALQPNTAHKLLQRESTQFKKRWATVRVPSFLFWIPQYLWLQVTATETCSSNPLAVFSLGGFCLQPKWQSSIGRCRKSGNRIYPNMAKNHIWSTNLLVILLFIWLHNKPQIQKSSFFLLFFSLLSLAIVNLQNQFNFQFLKIYFTVGETVKFRQSKEWLIAHH
jgi:hypothetical protein